jgi:hypothetical protein
VNDLREQLLDIVGDCCPLPQLGRAGTVEITAGPGVLERLEAHWKRLTPESRPRLHGISLSREPRRRLQLVLSPALRGPVVLLTAEIGESIPVFSEIWPYAEWWEEEIRELEGASIGGEGGPRRQEGVAWRLS